MLFLAKIWCLALAILASSFIYEIEAADNSVGTCYDDPKCGPESWTGICKSGTRQSPIDIITPNPFTFHTAPFELSEKYLSKIHWKFYGTVLTEFHNILFFLSNPNARKRNLKIRGGGLKGTYIFHHFHFHWSTTGPKLGALHLINRLKFPLELHLMHYKETFASFEEAVKSKDHDAIATMAVLFEYSVEDNPALNSLLTAMRRLTKSGTYDKMMEFKGLPLQLSSLYPVRKLFARYHGSIPGPPCAEIAIWSVFISTIPISKRQMQYFLNVNEDVANFGKFNNRPIQPLNNRTVTLFKGEFQELL